MISPNFRSLIFYIMYHFVRNYKDRFGIHVNTQAVVTFLNIGTCTTCLRMYHDTCYVSLSFIPYADYDSSGSMILVHIMVVLLIPIDTTFSCCLRP